MTPAEIVGPIDVDALLGAFLAKGSPFTIANGDAITLRVDDDNSDFDRSTSGMPYLVFRQTSRRILRSKLPYTPQTRTPTVTDILTAPATPAVGMTLQVSQRDIQTISRIRFYKTRDRQGDSSVGGLPVAGGPVAGDAADFVDVSGAAVSGLVIPVTTATYRDVYDAIQFIDPARLPFPGARIVVTYTHLLIDNVVLSDEMPVYRLTIHAGDLASGSKGATRAYAHHRLGAQLGEALEQFLMLNRGLNLAGVGALNVGRVIMPTTAGPIGKGEASSRWFIDLMLERKALASAKEGYTRIGHVDRTTTSVF